MEEEKDKAPEQPKHYEPMRGKLPPLVYEVAFLSANDEEEVARITARQLRVYEYDAIDDPFLLEPWFEVSADGTGLKGPVSVMANRARLKVVIEKLENCSGLDAADDKDAIAAYLDAPGNEELCYSGWIGYTKLARAKQVRVRPFRDTRAGTGGGGGEDSGRANEAGASA